MKLQKGCEYVSIRENDSVLINGKLDHWPPLRVKHIRAPRKRGRLRKEHMKMILRIDSPMRTRVRMKLSGNFSTGNGEYESRIVHAWLEDLVFYRLDFNKKKIYKKRVEATT